MDTQSLAKLPFNLKIIPVNAQNIPAGAPFIAMFNPEQFTIQETVRSVTEPPPGRSSTESRFVNTPPREFTMEFTIDGTGVNTNGVKIPVTAQVLLFRAATTTLISSDHQPPTLLVQYGPFICTCVLKSSSVTYTMFDMFGLPIRAKISASFTESIDNTLNAITSMLSSPDLTHRITVSEWDLLPLLCYRTYNNQDYYLQVARVNKLKNFRKLQPGTTLTFLPISKK
ncbi:MAG: hypothetical protein JSS75_00710 [Bacteroidetes bacterium]|nr:hypothetical protein [Bacteroidota bacterium]